MVKQDVCINTQLLELLFLSRKQSYGSALVIAAVKTESCRRHTELHALTQRLLVGPTHLSQCGVDTQLHHPGASWLTHCVK